MKKAFRRRDLLIGTTVGLASAALGATDAQAAWDQALVEYVSANPSIMGFAWFDQNKEVDWRIDSSATSSTAFAAALAARP